MDKKERLEQIMKDFNQNAGYGVFTCSAKDFYFILECIKELMEKE